MIEIRSYLSDAWVSGTGPGTTLVDPVNEEAIARAATEGLDLAAALEHARTVGGPALRALTFAERGGLLAALADTIHGIRDELLDLSIGSYGATRGDAKFDVDGATATLAAYAAIGRSLGARRFLLDGEGEQLGRSPRFHGQHVKVPRRGVAVHVNAFNFPAWGLAEKLACAFLAGVPVLTKPATATALPAFRIAEAIVAQGILPPGTWSFLGGGAGDLLDHLTGQDVVAFTGSASTAERLRAHPAVVRHAVSLNVEADSVNAAVLGPDVAPGAETWKLALHELVREMTQKAGQKCTATRRVLVPEARLDDFIGELRERLLEVKVGPPADPGTRMGPLATLAQKADVERGLARLAAVAERVIGDGRELPARGAFVAPQVFVARDRENPLVHELEVFGPVATLIPYDGSADEAAALVSRGGGGLVATVYSDDLAFVEGCLFGLAPWHGRILLGSQKIAEHSTGPGMVLPGLLHGGPGRAGGGRELGGLRGLDLYLQTCAVQGARPVLERLLGTPAGA